MKKMFANNLSLKKQQKESCFLSDRLFSICGFCGCKFSFDSDKIDFFAKENKDFFICCFCSRHGLFKKNVFLFSFCKIFEIIISQNKKEVKNIVKNLYYVSNSFPFLFYNPEADYWAIDIEHESIRNKDIVFKAITDMFDVFKVLNNTLYLNLRYIKKELLEELSLFFETKKQKTKIFKGSQIF